MSLPRETMLELMALADGELEGEAKDRAEKLTIQSEEAQRVVGAMRAPGVRPWLREAVAQRAPLADGIADAVMAKLAAGGGYSAVPAETEARRAAAVGDLGVRSAVRNTAAVRALASARSRRASPMAMVRIAGSALAIAALVAVYVRSRESADERPRAQGVGTSSGAAAPRERAVAIAGNGGTQSGRGVEVEEIDSALRVSIFEISAVAETSTQPSVVVWIDDEPGQQ
jgi:hypothetical protein